MPADHEAREHEDPQNYFDSNYTLMTAVTPNTLQKRPNKNFSSLERPRLEALSAAEIQKQNSSPFKAKRRFEQQTAESFYLRQETLMPEIIPKHDNGRLIPINSKAMKDYQNQDIS